MAAENDETRLADLLLASEVLDEDLGKLLNKCQPKSKRGAISLALCSAAFGHGLSQRVLLEIGLTGTALALCRLHFEAVVRAAWTGQGATDKWLDAFTSPIEGEEHREPTMGPPISAMLDTFGEHAPHVAAELRKLYTTISVLHSFVHGGAHAVAHALMGGYPADKLIAALQNRNLLQLYLANAAVVAAQDPMLLPRMRLLREKYAGVTPSGSSDLAISPCAGAANTGDPLQSRPTS